VPADWKRSDPPEETPDFSRDDAFQPLLVCVAPCAPVRVTVAIRPAGGTPAEHAARLRGGEGYHVEVSPAIIASRVGVACDGTRDSDLGPVRLRLFFFEDAGTLWQVGTTAPAALWSGVETALTAVIASAELNERPANMRRPTAAPRDVERAVNVAEAVLRLLQVAACA